MPSPLPFFLMPSRICTAGLGFLPSECPLHFTPLGAARILPYNLGRGGHGSAPGIDRSHLGSERRLILLSLWQYLARVLYKNLIGIC